MDRPEDRFQELLAHVVAQGTRMLRERKYVRPFGLGLQEDGTIRPFIATVDGDPGASLPLLIAGMRSRAASREFVACAVVQPGDDESIVVFLEDEDGGCSDVRVPVTSERGFDVANAHVALGVARVFAARP